MGGGTVRAMACIKSSGMTPGPLGIEDTRPMASAPASIAVRASSTLLMQQILTLTRITEEATPGSLAFRRLVEERYARARPPALAHLRGPLPSSAAQRDRSLRHGLPRAPTPRRSEFLYQEGSGVSPAPVRRTARPIDNRSPPAAPLRRPAVAPHRERCRRSRDETWGNASIRGARSECGRLRVAHPSTRAGSARRR